MTLLAHYYLPGMDVEEHSTRVPLDWGNPAESEPISLFYRVLSAPGEGAGEGGARRDMPLLLFLQGGPGGPAPRPTSPTDDGWIAEALKHYRIVLPDQRGTGRSSRVTAATARRFSDPRALADHLHHFLADSIIRDFEHLRRTEFEGRHWDTLGQSYGGFLTLTYLSLFPGAVRAAFTTGGIPAVPASPETTYAHTVPMMMAKTRRFYERYPGDEARAAALADRLAAGGATLPDGSPLTVLRLRMAGQGLGMKPGAERLHWLLDDAFAAGDGSVPAQGAAGAEIPDALGMAVLDATSSWRRPLYWVLQEFIYQDGGEAGECAPAAWAAARRIEATPGMGDGARPLMFIGEAAMPGMFREDRSLQPFAAAEDLLMADTRWGRIYDTARLEANETPLQAAVYADDLYVPRALSEDTLSRVGRSHAWITNEFEHDGVHGPVVFARLYNEARDRGDLAKAQ